MSDPEIKYSRGQNLAFDIKLAQKEYLTDPDHAIRLVNDAVEAAVQQGRHNSILNGANIIEQITTSEIGQKYKESAVVNDQYYLFLIHEVTVLAAHYEHHNSRWFTAKNPQINGYSLDYQALVLREIKDMQQQHPSHGAQSSLNTKIHFLETIIKQNNQEAPETQTLYQWVLSEVKRVINFIKALLSSAHKYGGYFYSNNNSPSDASAGQTMISIDSPKRTLRMLKTSLKTKPVDSEKETQRHLLDEQPTPKDETDNNVEHASNSEIKTHVSCKFTR